MKGTLLQEQSVDQAGFRAGFSCDDHLFVVTLMSEMFHELHLPLWLVAVDFRKAFDTVSHTGLWLALLQQGVPSTYIRVLIKIYSGQSGKVQGDRLSKPFDIQRGVRQGDPISPLLFNAVLEKIMREVAQSWHTKRWGVKPRGRRRLLNLRFADDLLLVGASLHQAKSMLRDLIAKAREYGLEVHETKTKILWNGIGRGTPAQHAEMDGRTFEILPAHGSSMYLGRLLSLCN